MAEQMLPQSACRAIWALLEKGNAVTIDHACETSLQDPWVVFRYFQLLEKHGYLSLAGYQLATGDEILATFTLIKRTGRDAPYIDKDGRFVDPNQPGRYARAKSIAMRARIRIAAESFNGSFSAEELRNAVLSDRDEFAKINQTIGSLRRDQELLVEPDGLRLQTDIVPRRVRELIKRDYIGLSFTFDQLGEMVGPIHPNIRRRILTELKAEGFTVTLQRPRTNGRKVRAYLVEVS